MFKHIVPGGQNEQNCFPFGDGFGNTFDGVYSRKDFFDIAGLASANV